MEIEEEVLKSWIESYEYILGLWKGLNQANKKEVERLKAELTEVASRADVYKRDAENLQRTLEEAGERIEELEQQLAELPKKICKEVLKEADKCFYTDPQSETPLTRKALKVILHQIQQKYTKGETK